MPLLGEHAILALRPLFLEPNLPPTRALQEALQEAPGGALAIGRALRGALGGANGGALGRTLRSGGTLLALIHSLSITPIDLLFLAHSLGHETVRVIREPSSGEGD